MITTIQTVAVIGGTGKSGQYLVQQLIKQGFHIRLLVRNPAHFSTPHEQIEVVPGSVEEDAIQTLLQGTQAVISTLGMGNPPSAPTIFTQSTSQVLQAMEAYGISRYIVTTGLNVNTPFDKKGPKTMAATEYMLNTYPASTLNKQQEYELLAESLLNWTLVRLPRILLTNERQPIATDWRDCLGDHINATDLAQFLIDQLHDNYFTQQAPFIANVP